MQTVIGPSEHNVTAATPESTAGPGHRIRSVSIIGGFLDGTQFEFVDGLNCLIGARGAGKTTVVELVRFALDILPTREANAGERRRIESLVEKNLAGGRVKVTIETKDGLTYVVSRTPGEEPIVLTSDGKPTEITLKLGGLFRADVFSQNEVESIADRTTSQLELIDNFEAEQIAEVESQLNQVRSDLAANASQITPLQAKIAAIGDELGTLAGVEERLKKYSTAGGDDAAAINGAHALKSLRDRERRIAGAANQALQDFGKDLATLNGRLDQQTKRLTDREVANGPNGRIVQETLGYLADCGNRIDQLLRQATDLLGEVAKRMSVSNGRLSHAHKEQELAFRQLIEKHQHARGQAAERSQLERRRNELLAKKRLRQQLEEQLAALLTNRTSLLDRLSALLDKRFSIRQAVAERINANLSPAIRVDLLRFGSPERYQRLLEDGLKNARLKHLLVAQKLAQTFWPIDLVEVIRRQDASALVERAELNAEQADKVVAALANLPLLFDLETVELLDLPRIELKDGNNYKDSLSLSTGQKCTAILPILLLDSENPLIVDQPEDNLDNRFIFEAVVESIRRVKRHRQLVFVTHNPNIPVLGDAERVFVLDSDGSNARKANEGTVDEVKPDIVTLLEGGEDAFKARKCRYAY